MSSIKMGVFAETIHSLVPFGIFQPQGLNSEQNLESNNQMAPPVFGLQSTQGTKFLWGQVHAPQKVGFCGFYPTTHTTYTNSLFFHIFPIIPDSPRSKKLVTSKWQRRHPDLVAPPDQNPTSQPVPAHHYNPPPLLCLKVKAINPLQHLKEPKDPMLWKECKTWWQICISHSKFPLLLLTWEVQRATYQDAMETVSRKRRPARNSTWGKNHGWSSASDIASCSANAMEQAGFA
ncbi:uncharacterized protein EI90DRAFT_3021238 [Cantharellus anzutake]|uniref:uncharacterized protein n=1 Tax=Cantharellus anzutake TaxID=1750568 RepID=UPI0019058C17|nr:uncharacterized protein EI90DRAFT_3021238 [Cantharellus anzutake]KAF8317835.1 hypothetical protein EI90DRAFT_3021238 [Cantharellus anzutake]